jgi:D-alanyl-D-alanine carboxypeptidase (penicillin-binding protein 5/6)
MNRYGIVAAVTALLGATVAHAAPPAIDTTAKQAILIDYDTGTVLWEMAADDRMAPSSMSKLMTLAIAFDRLKDGSITDKTLFHVSVNAWKTGGSKTDSSTRFLKESTDVSVGDLLQGIAVQSGNDACIVMAEGLAGNEASFADLENKKAAEIGLTGSHFVDSSGLPDPQHYMTARDLSILGRYIIKTYPDRYPLFAEKEFTYNNIKQGNRNPLLYTLPGADGLKTGHTEAGGYGLVGSAVVGGRRQIVVLNGMSKMSERSTEANSLMAWGFANFQNRTLFKAGDVASSAEVWLGTEDQVPLVIERDLALTVPRGTNGSFKVTIHYNGPIPAPIAKGTVLASLTVTSGDSKIAEVPLVAGASVEKLGFTGRVFARLKSILAGHSSAPAPLVK